MLFATSAITTTISTTAVAALGIVVGWFVIGTQRVTEELTKERRVAYAALLAQVDAVRAECASGRTVQEPSRPATHECCLPRDQATDATCDLIRLCSAAELLSSDEMKGSKLVTSLVASTAADPSSWEEVRARFLIAAKWDTHRNSSRLRRRAARRGDYGPFI